MKVLRHNIHYWLRALQNKKLIKLLFLEENFESKIIINLQIYHFPQESSTVLPKFF